MKAWNVYGRWFAGMALYAALFSPLPGSAQIKVLEENQAPGRAMAQQVTKGGEIWITADHSQHPILKKEFKSGPEVTESCLSCHDLAAGQFQKTIHWTWLDPNHDPQAQGGQGRPQHEQLLHQHSVQ